MIASVAPSSDGLICVVVRMDGARVRDESAGRTNIRASTGPAAVIITARRSSRAAIVSGFFALDSTYMSPEQLAWLEKELSANVRRWPVRARFQTT